VFYPVSLLGGLDLARRAVTAHQTAAQIAGHNLANASTPGYTRQRPELVPGENRTGVDVASVSRMRDRFLDFSLLNEQQALGRNQAQESLMQRLQVVFDDAPGEGVSALLDQFYQGFQQLSATPTDAGVRVTLKDTGERIGETFQVMRQRVDQLKTDLAAEIQQRVTDANGLTTQIAELNKRIVAAKVYGDANDLMDQRDLLVTRLGEIVGVTASDRSDGGLQLALTGTGVLLVDGQASFALTATPNGGTDTIDLAVDGSVALTPRSGEISALLDARNLSTGAVKQAVADLDTLAGTIALRVNRLHASGTGLTEHTALTAVNAVSSAAVALNAAGLAVTPVNGSFKVIVHDTTGAVTANAVINITAGTTTLTDVQTALNAVTGLTATISSGTLTITAAANRTFTFANDTSDTLAALGLNTFFTGSTASTLAVNSLVANDVTKIAAATADSADLVHQGDGSNALALAGLRTALAMATATQTFTDFYGATVARIGSQTQAATEGVSRQEAAVQLVESLQQQVAGVSIDEEMISLSQSQAAYGAAARYAGTINEMIETLFRLFGVAA
jgi:flagellar hook-associated protein 1 FlgK